MLHFRYFFTEIKTETSSLPRKKILKRRQSVMQATGLFVYRCSERETSFLPLSAK